MLASEVKTSGVLRNALSSLRAILLVILLRLQPFLQMLKISPVRLPYLKDEVDLEQPQEAEDKVSPNRSKVKEDKVFKDNMGTTKSDCASTNYLKLSNKKKNKAVKNSSSPSFVEDKENLTKESDNVVDDVFAEVDNKKENFDFPKPKPKLGRMRRTSECVGRRCSPPAGTQPRGILKRRGRSFSESHIGSLEECLGEELLCKYGTVEEALVTEYGCLEGLLEECGWEDDEEGLSVGSKKSVRFNDSDKTHLFSSKASIVNQLANDEKRAMRVKMKEAKKLKKIERRQLQKTGTKFNSSYKKNSDYTSFDEATTDESEGGEFLSTSSCSETTESSDTDASETGEKKAPATDPASFAQHRRQRNFNKKGKKNKKVELTNNMIFQLDMEAQ